MASIGATGGITGRSTPTTIGVPPAQERRGAEVELVTGETALLHSSAIPAAGEDRGRVAVLELEREHPGIPPHLVAPLTLRERQVATVVVDGLSDREIAETLSLGHHTVTQHVKRIYRKLDVDSRVTLTRALLRPLAAALSLP